MSISCIIRNTKQIIGLENNKRNLFHWLNIIFNKVDEQRRKELGPDRTCAEWLLRNGASVKWANSNDYLTDYNLLPSEQQTQLLIHEIDATDSSISHYGFKHFIGCKLIRKIIFHNCSYLEDPALAQLSPLTDSLRDLQITQCLNITDKGLKSLTKLVKLEKLVLADLPYVKNKETVLNELKNVLPNCNINFQ